MRFGESGYGAVRSSRIGRGGLGFGMVRRGVSWLALIGRDRSGRVRVRRGMVWYGRNWFG